MLFVFLQTKIVIKDICDWQDGTLTEVYNDQKTILYTQKWSQCCYKAR